MAYLAPFYLTIFLHITPIKHSGKLLDIFTLVEYEAVDQLLLGLLTSNRSKILNFKTEDQIIIYFKEDLMKESLKNDGVGSFVLADSLERFLGMKEGTI